MAKDDWSKEDIRQLLTGFIVAYPRREEAEGVVEAAGMGVADVPWHPRMRDTWRGILEEAGHQRRVGDLVEATMNDPKKRGYRQFFQDLKDGCLARDSSTAGPPLRRVVDEDRLAAHYEKIIGAEPTFRGISFLQRGIDCARSVALIRMTIDNARYTGTASLIAPDTLLTCHHCLFDGAGNKATEVEVWFDFETDMDGRDIQPVKFVSDPTTFRGDESADWAILKLPEAISDRTPLTFAKERAKQNDWVAIIQHPAGLHKQIALHNNTVRYVDDEVIQYLTDTLPGSSGSPVFNDHWEMIALHHAGGDLPLPGTDSTVFRNQGITIQRIAAQLASEVG